MHTYTYVNIRFIYYVYVFIYYLHVACVEGVCRNRLAAAVCCSVLQCVAVCCSVLQCDAVCCSMLQCVAVATESLLRLLYTICNLRFIYYLHFAFVERVYKSLSSTLIYYVAVCCSCNRIAAQTLIYYLHFTFAAESQQLFQVLL